MSLSKTNLLVLCKSMGITRTTGKTKEQLSELIRIQEEAKGAIIIQEQTKEIKYIYHAADIHIRMLERHQEYTVVFDNLVSYLKTQENLTSSVFVICGDIFHNKDRLVSETILLFNKFIDNLTSIIDVIIIAGNHDTFTHNDRLDTITGIVDIKKYQNFHYLKWSGIYRYHNIDFVVSSLLDNKFIRADELPKSQQLKVALYHGALVNSKMDNAYKIQGDQLLTTADFKGYNLVLLGDIHKRQHLTPTIAYPGSLIQQNYKEELLHGILKWELSSLSSTFVPIHNDYGYITISDKFDEIEFPKKSRVKLIHAIDNDINFDEIKKQLAKKTTIISISKEISSSTVTTTESEDELPISHEEYEHKYFNELIKGYSTDIKNELSLLHANCVNTVDTSESTNLVTTWELSTLEFTNVFIYGGNHKNIISFDKKGVIGILQSNAAGKSSIFNIIMYTLFGSITKNKSYHNRNIINKNAKTYKIVLTIKMNNETYTITREGKNKTRKNQLSMDETLTFQCDTTNLTDSNKIKTNELIKKTFGLSEPSSFTLTNVMSYSNYVSLLTMTSSDISKTFTKLFNLEKYTEIYSKVLKKYKEITESIKLKSKEIDTIEKNTGNTIDQHIIDEMELDIIDITEELQLLESKLKKLIKNETKLKSEVVVLPKVSLEEVQNKLKKLTNLHYSFPLETVEHLINETKKSIDKHYKHYKHDSPINITETLQELQDQLSTITYKTTEHVCTKKEYKLANKQIETFNIDSKLDKILEILEMSYINENILDVADHGTIKDFVLSLKDDSLLTRYIDSKLLVSDYILNEESILYNNEQNDLKAVLDTKINVLLHKELDQLQEYEEYLVYTEYKRLYDLHEINKENTDKLKTIKDTMNIISQNKKELQTELKDLYTTLARHKLVNSQHKIANDKIKILQESMINLKKEENIYKIYKGIVNDKALPKLILNDTIKKVELEANKLVYSLAGLLIKINESEIDLEVGKWDLTIKKNNMILGTEQVSGYERFIINVGLKMAIDKHKFYAGTNIFFIDEAFDCVSEDNFDKIDELFDYLKTNVYKNILIISHNEELKKKVDHLINIETDYVCSKIN